MWIQGKGDADAGERGIQRRLHTCIIISHLRIHMRFRVLSAGGLVESWLRCGWFSTQAAR